MFYTSFKILSALLSLLEGSECILKSPPPNPEYEGKRLSSWLVYYESRYRRDDRQIAWTNHALKNLGTNAVPYLINDLKARDPAWVAWLIKSARLFQTADFLYTGMEFRMVVNGKGLRVRHLSPMQRGRIAQRALIVIGEKAAPWVAPLLNDQDAITRKFATGYFAYHPSESVVPQLAQLLNDPESEISRLAAEALDKLGTSSKLQIAPLAASLGGSNGRDAAEALSKCGTEGLELLLKALESIDGPTRYHARYGIGRATHEVKIAALPRINRLAQHHQRIEIRENATYLLMELGPFAKPALPFLISSLLEETCPIRLATINALVEIDPNADGADKAILQALKDNYSPVPPVAIMGLAKRQNAREYLEFFFDGINRKDWFYRHAAVVGLGNSGAAAKPAVPVIAALIQQCDSKQVERRMNSFDLRSTCVKALEKIDPDALCEIPDIE